MLFSSTTFLFLFLPVMLLGYHLVFRGLPNGQNGFLLVGSLLFYAWGEPWFVLVMLGSILLNYALGLWAHARRSRDQSPRPAVIAALTVNLALLFVFKYLTFTIENLTLLGLQAEIPVIRLPIGISFFTFQALSYVLDVAWGKTQVQRSPLLLGLYISFFPQLIAGPIVKYDDIARQLTHRTVTWDSFSAGTVRFLIGLGKKVFLSNQLALIADRAHEAAGGVLPASLAWLGMLCYTLQIYYDFSGYSDMAIGLGGMFGFRIRENFHYPYFASSVTDFWRRWHISLSSWFRDYVYIPLGGSRTGSTAKTIRNLFVVWTLTGLWHGANWTFVAWGLFYFVLLCLEKFCGLWAKWPVWLRRPWTFLLVNFGWVLFRADDLTHAGQYFAALFGAHGWTSAKALLLFRENLPILIFSVLFMFPFAPLIRDRLSAPENTCPKPLAAAGGVLGGAALACLMLVCLCYLVKGSYNPFIYFNF